RDRARGRAPAAGRRERGDEPRSRDARAGARGADAHPHRSRARAEGEGARCPQRAARGDDGTEDLPRDEPRADRGQERSGHREELVDPDEVAEEVDPDALLAREEVTGVHGRGDEEAEPKTMIATASSLSPKSLAGRAMPEGLARGGQMTVTIDEPIELSARLL